MIFVFHRIERRDKSLRKGAEKNNQNFVSTEKLPYNKRLSSSTLYRNIQDSCRYRLYSKYNSRVAGFGPTRDKETRGNDRFETSEVSCKIRPTKVCVFYRASVRYHSAVYTMALCPSVRQLQIRVLFKRLKIITRTKSKYKSNQVVAGTRIF